MNKLKFALIIFSFLLFGIANALAMPNPWIDCGADLSCGAKKAGFDFPLNVQIYSVRAMDDMMEIKFPLDKNRVVVARKSQFYKGIVGEHGIVDISGDYNIYPVNKSIRLKNGVFFNVRGKRSNFYVANFAAESAYYSFYCKNGMKKKDIEYLYKILEEAEAPKCDF